MSVFSAVYGRRGDGGFSGPVLGASSGVVGFSVAMVSRQSALSPGLVGDVAREAGCGGGFAALEAGWRRVAGVSGS